MASNAATECPVCNEDFNETDKCPRSLPCSHSLCSECLHNLIIRNTKICPFCRQRFNANAVRDVGVNIGLLDVLKLLREMEARANYSPYRAQYTPQLNWRELLKKEHEDIANENISKCKAVQNTHGLIQNLKELLSSSKSKKKEEELIAKTRAMAISDTKQQITGRTLNEKENQVQLLREGKVFVVHEIGGTLRYTKLSSHDGNRMCLHYLKQQNLPPNARTFRYDTVISMIDPSSRLAFLELSDANRRVLGRLYIRLAPESKRATQFSALCTAEKGPTFAFTEILGVWAMDSAAQRVWFGDYEGLEGKGGRAVVPDVWNEEGEPYTRPWVAGTVVGKWPGTGEEEAAQFFILTKNNQKKNAKWCFGMVEEGLEILTEAVSYYADVKSIFISDSGLVIPFSSH